MLNVCNMLLRGRGDRGHLYLLPEKTLILNVQYARLSLPGFWMHAKAMEAIGLVLPVLAARPPHLFVGIQGLAKFGSSAGVASGFVRLQPLLDQSQQVHSDRPHGPVSPLSIRPSPSWQASPDILHAALWLRGLLLREVGSNVLASRSGMIG